MNLLNKTPAWVIETFLGVTLGIASGYYAFKYHKVLKLDPGFADKLLSVSIALFGFLLVILTLIIQSSSDVVTAMKQNNLYSRLITFNKKVIFLTAIVSILSMLILFFKDMEAIKIRILPIMVSINLTLFVWALVDTFFYIRIFYKIIAK